MLASVSSAQAGNYSVIDVFDRNSYAGDVRQQFINMNFMTQSAWDFAADARGYTWGLAAEYYRDDWALRAGRFIGPRLPWRVAGAMDPRSWLATPKLRSGPCYKVCDRVRMDKPRR